MNCRRAVSLVELLLAMSACTVILTMSTALIHRVLHTQSKTRAFFGSERAALRLADQFRRDVHAATSAITDTDSLNAGVFLRLQTPGNRAIEYRQSEGTILRLVLDTGEIRAREEFAFSSNITLAARQESPRLVELTITSQPDSLGVGDARESMAYTAPVTVQTVARLNRTPGVTDSPAPENPSP